MDALSPLYPCVPRMRFWLGLAAFLSAWPVFGTPAVPNGAKPFAFGRPLTCAAQPLEPEPAFANALSMVSAKPEVADLSWALNAMRTAGFPAGAILDEKALKSAEITSWLAKRGNIVSAKAFNDLSSKVPGYAGYSQSMESFLTVMTQPVNHGTDIDPAARNLDRSNTGTLDRTSNRLAEIINRAKTVSKAMGAHYRMPQIRLYLLAHGFKDEVGVLALSHAVCGLNLDKESVEKLNVSARYMAMPIRPETPRTSAQNLEKLMKSLPPRTASSPAGDKP